MVPVVRLDEQRMTVGLVPDPQSPVKQLGPRREVHELGDAVGEEEDGDGVSGQIVDVAPFEDQIDEVAAGIRSERVCIRRAKLTRIAGA